MRNKRFKIVMAAAATAAAMTVSIIPVSASSVQPYENSAVTDEISDAESGRKENDEKNAEEKTDEGSEEIVCEGTFIKNENISAGNADECENASGSHVSEAGTADTENNPGKICEKDMDEGLCKTDDTDNADETVKPGAQNSQSEESLKTDSIDIVRQSTEKRDEEKEKYGSLEPSLQTAADEKTYHTDETDETIRKGIIRIGENEYLFNEDGSPAKGLAIYDGKTYAVGDDGAIIRGQDIEIDKTIYRTDENGLLANGWVVSGKNRCFYSDGIKKTGIFTAQGKTYAADGSGTVIICQWITDNGSRYHTDENGCILTGWQMLNGRKYYFADEGLSEYDGSMSGKLVTAPSVINGTKYYFNASGALETDRWIKTDGKRIYVDKNGTAASGWKTILGSIYYLEDEGQAVTGWKDINGLRYFDSTGKMCTGWKNINGKTYYFIDEKASSANAAEIGSLADGIVKLNGKDVFYFRNGIQVKKAGWLKCDGKTYYFTSNGTAKKGWQKINGNRYYFDAGGAMKTGWVSSDGKRYYMTKSGSMKTGWLKVNGKLYYLGSDGAARTGWMKKNEKSYYFNKDGSMQTGAKKIGSNIFVFGANGTMLKDGWKRYDNVTYYLDQNGIARTGWFVLNGKKFRFDANGAMLKGAQKIGNSVYVFDTNGVMQKNRWFTSSGRKYNLSSDGKAKTGWQVINGNKYYFNNAGVMQTGAKTISGKQYYFYSGGSMAAGKWVSRSGEKYYYKKDGTAASGALKIDGTTYRFTKDGMLCTGIFEQSGKIYMSTVNGKIDEAIDTSKIVSIILKNGMAVSTDRNKAYISADTIATVPDKNDNAQKWELIKRSDGTYDIKNIFNRMYLVPGKNSNYPCMVGTGNATGWEINDNGINIYSGKNTKGKLYAAMQKSTAPVNKKDIHYVDEDKVYKDVENELANGKTGTYTVKNVNYTDASKIWNKFMNEYITIDSHIPSVVDTSGSINKGAMSIDLTKALPVYKKKVAAEKAYIEAEKKCGVTAKMTDREKVRQINRYICLNYEWAIGSDSMYGMMVKKHGACVQHSILFNYLCKKSGISSEKVSLNGKNGIGHALNRVYIDGKWYYCDTMFNNCCFGTKDVYEDYLFMRNLKNAPANAYKEYDLDNISYTDRVN